MIKGLLSINTSPQPPPNGGGVPTLHIVAPMPTLHIVAPISASERGRGRYEPV